MIFGLNGLKQSGKDTTGDYLAAAHGFVLASFAKPLKQSAAAALGIPDPAVFEVWKNNPDARVLVTIDGIVEVDISIRVYLQNYGTQAHRLIPEFGENVWVDMIYGKLNPERVAITDCRFPNEAHAVHAAGGIVVKLDREVVKEGDEHESEAELPPELVDVVLDNNGSLGDLYMALDRLVEKEEAL